MKTLCVRAGAFVIAIAFFSGAFAGDAGVPQGGAARRQQDRTKAIAEFFHQPIFTEHLYQPAYSLEEMRRRRERVFEHIGANLAVLCGADAQEDWERFGQYNNFYYLTGFEMPNSVLLLDGARKRSALFLRTRAQHWVRFDGPELQPGEEAARLTGMDEVLNVDQFAESLRRAVSESPAPRKIFTERSPGERGGASQDLFHIYLQPRRDFPLDRRSHRLGDFAAAIFEQFPQAEVADLSEFLHEMRRVKSAEEIALMREAANLGAHALAEAIRATRPGIRESDLEAICRYEFTRGGAEAAWTPIVASGPNIHVFHYQANRRQLQDGDLILIDVGPKLRYYCADITRTWPVSGTLTGRRRELYEACLTLHKTCVAAVRPGITIDQLNAVYHQKAEELGIGEYVYYAIGHYTGMAPHDVGDRDKPFEPGVVFNVEPFLDIPEENVHIRFEDTVVVTQDGREVLSLTPELPWEADELIRLRDEPSRFE
ncbi:MAG: aminopeptidase P family protein [Planctomycetes bacterium]|nr:aminopeptidase P family protein [Planctomycetota bacterium]